MEVTKIKGINEKRAKDLEKLGITDTADLIGHFPRAYLDLRQAQSLKYAYHNDFVLTPGKIISIPMNAFAVRKGGFVKAVCEQEGFIFTVIWFNQPYVLSKLVQGKDYLFYGRVNHRNGQTSIVNPTYEFLENSVRMQGIIPQYSLKGSLTQKVMRSACLLAVNLEKPKSIIPSELQVKYGLGDLYSAYKTVHNPSNEQELREASNRIATEEYFSLISAYKFIKGDRNQARANEYSCTDKQLLDFIVKRFPFEFTDGQKQAVNGIFSNMKSPLVMNKLLQGDVGSGKTAVSMCAVFVCVSSGYQAVLLSPTEVLAQQNFNAVKNAFPDYNVEILTGSTSAKEKTSIKKAVKEGLVNILVGTHAVIQEDVVFKKLSLCVCDEQQRFGVAQRSSLLAKGVTPDVLVMSATPIPRTLSLIFYGDLDITTILDKPKMRIPIQTNLVPSHKYNDMLKFIENQVKEGRQAYFVCPKIEGDEEGTLMSVTELYQSLTESLPSLRIGLLHGKMKDKEKNAVMYAFKDKLIDLLVSTTVIEVGVDVPNASVMVIYNAERFGLSQLHQLRGRVGRSNLKSYCFLLTNSNSPIAIERLKVIKENSDGFKISEKDFKLRGSGDILGSRQSGKVSGELGSLVYDTEYIFLAKKISDEVFERAIKVPEIREVAIKKYHKLKDVALN